MNQVPEVKDFSLILSQGEQLALLKQPNHKAPTGLRNLCMIMLMLKAGLRAGEILALQVDNLDLQPGKVHITKSGAAQERTLWLDEDLTGSITKWLQIRPHESTYLFTTLKGGRLKDRYLREMVKRLARKAGIAKDVHPHLLRSTFAVQLIRETNDIRLAQRALGHREISTTQAYVKHLFKEHSMAYYDLLGYRRSGIPVEGPATGKEQGRQQTSHNLAVKSIINTNEPLSTDHNSPTGSTENIEIGKGREEDINSRDSSSTGSSEKDNRAKIFNQAYNNQTLNDQPFELENIESNIKKLDDKVEKPPERTAIPALKCSQCPYVLHFRENCPRCGATFESILEYWRKYT